MTNLCIDISVNTGGNIYLFFWEKNKDQTIENEKCILIMEMKI
jgi:hypothetical protein